MKSDILKQLLADRAAKRQVVMATDLASGQVPDRGQLLYPGETDGDDELLVAARRVMLADKSGIVETTDGRKVFLHVYNPPLRMLIVGAVHIAQPLSQMAMLAGYDVAIVDPRREFASADRFPGITLIDAWPDDGVDQFAPDRRTAIVTLTHDPKLDDPALIKVLRSDVFYIGCLGSNRTHGKRLERLGMEGFSEADFARIHGPIGLDIGGKSPAEIAVSIIAEITEALRRPKQAQAAE
ncbi:MAG: XdhC family protein [Rhodospirillaceae bacterium]|jgi:xanthine dehydrogenase accessory factor|nr:XdhC family protein [Rhodospirillaceae bacterium]MBT4045872.1 XdhC family protein [Rhodospirillaceae bacterium]MBT4687069.1 XdhC family protein [Rhodospirillaceae bacterium]MBT5082585.1 XdhC family protein [Rhodospirillaceae bacterium]MBT5526085.1 XdhC family protein [Rhodospirillaceae bacterium]